MRHEWISFRERAGLSQESLAVQLGVSRSYVQKIEQALFNEAPYLSEFSALFKVDQNELRAAYHSFQYYQRSQFALSHASFLTLLGNYDGPIHPLVYYRNYYDLSQIGLCKSLCLHPTPVANYESNHQREVPSQLKQVCREMGWSSVPLDEAVSRWRFNGYADKIPS